MLGAIVSDGGSALTIAVDFADFIQRLIPHEDVYDTDGNLRAEAL